MSLRIAKSFQQFAKQRQQSSLLCTSMCSVMGSTLTPDSFAGGYDNNSNKKIHQYDVTARTMTVLSKQSGEEYKKMNYSSRMKETGRPVSPHVTIYAFPIAALSSITNRVTGIAMAVGCFGLGSLELIGGSGTALYCIQYIGSSSTIVAMTAKFSLMFPISYHYICGLRHLRWDQQPDLLTNAQVTTSSYYLFGTATAISFVAAIL